MLFRYCWGCSFFGAGAQEQEKPGCHGVTEKSDALAVAASKKAGDVRGGMS